MNEKQVVQEAHIALKCIAIFYGLPAYGHERCSVGKRGQLVTRDEPDIERKYCSACGKKLIPLASSINEQTDGGKP